jgi:hypothetical protein
MAGHDPGALRIELLGRQLSFPQVARAEHHGEPEQGQLAAHLAAHSAVAAGHHGHRQVSVHAHHPP